MNLSPNVQELFHDALDEPKPGTQVLRIFTPFGKLPFQYLESLLMSQVQQRNRTLREVQVCIESTLRPCLLDINDDFSLNLRFTSLTMKWHASGLSLKFFFLHPSVQVGICRQPFRNFVEKDLAKAIAALREHDVELSDILGEESVLDRAYVSGTVAYGYASNPTDLEDEML